MIKISSHQLEAEKQAIMTHAFNEEMYKIAASQAFPELDWNNLSDEDLEKLAKWYPGKFLAKGLGFAGQAAKNVAKGAVKGVKTVAKGVGTAAKATGKYMGEKFQEVGPGAKQVAKGLADVGKGAVKTVGGVAKGTAGMASDAVKTVGKGAKAVAGGVAATGKKWGENLKEDFQAGQDAAGGNKKQTIDTAPKEGGGAPAEGGGGKGETDVNTTKSVKSSGEGKFGPAFAAARKAGKKEFSWQGKQYNTNLA